MQERQRNREFEFTRKHFDAFRRISQNHTGIIVPDNKFEMFYARLTKRLRALGLSGFSEYLQYLEAHRELEFTCFINALTTNLTSFFRENHHFEFLRDNIVPEFLDNGGRCLKIWSAGCSTGEETYSIAITLAELSATLNFDWNLIATDIDTDVLRQASNGVYQLDSLRDIPQAVKKKWFLRGKGKNEGLARISPELKNKTRFRQLNLIEPFSFQEPFDVIFCRNVVIYFDRDTKCRLMQKFDASLKPGGYLFMGHSESLHGIADHLESKGRTIYQKLAKVSVC